MSGEAISDSTFSGADIEEALSVLPEDLALGMLRRLGDITSRKKEQEEIRRVNFVIAELAIAAHQNVVSTDDTPDMLDVIMWDRFANDTSQAFVGLYAKLGEERKRSIPQSVVDWAVYRHVKHELISSCEEEDINIELAPMGATVQSVCKRCLDLMVELGVFESRTLEELQAMMPDPENFAWGLVESANEFDRQLEARMRIDLLQAGYTLPELAADNTYGYDSEAEEFIIPRVDDDMFPGSGE